MVKEVWYGAASGLPEGVGDAGSEGDLVNGTLSGLVGEIDTECLVILRGNRTSCWGRPAPAEPDDGDLCGRETGGRSSRRLLEGLYLDEGKHPGSSRFPVGLTSETVGEVASVR